MRDFSNLDHESLFGVIPGNFLYYDLPGVKGLASKKNAKIINAFGGRHSKGKYGKKGPWTNRGLGDAGMVSEGFAMGDNEKLVFQDLAESEQTNEMFRKYWARERKNQEESGEKEKSVSVSQKGELCDERKI